MIIKQKLMPIFLLVINTNCLYGQIDKSEKDSIYIQEVENQKGSDKVLHAEPLYIDLIRDLGARKGEKEWNIGLGLTDQLNFDSYEALIEYEWAPINRLGLEVELPFTFHTSSRDLNKDSLPSNRLDALKVAVQWSFYVNEKIATSLAIGYINEFELSPFQSFGKPLIAGNVYNPFIVGAKRWGNNFHSLIYTGPMIEYNYRSRKYHIEYDINTSFHYMIPGTRNFIGMEFNKSIYRKDFDMTIRPQMRLGISDDLMVGIVAGIPIEKKNERFSAFVRLIWEPGHAKNKH